MALTIPTTQESTDNNIARLESALGQTAPSNDKSFLRVLAVVEALIATGLYKFGAERIKQCLALTATGDGLDVIGNEYNTPRKLSASTVLTATLPALTGTLIPATAGFIGAANGLRYYLDAAAEAVSGTVTLSMTAETPGVVGNLDIGATLTIVSGVAGAEQTATVTEITTTGADAETDTAYRPRVLFAMRATTGGSNATDHKIWAEGVAGVVRAYPFSGKPVGSVDPSYPGDRTVYVECDASIDPDGVAPTSLLDDVRAALNTDPDTGISRPTLGLTDASLYVEPINRTAVDVQITNLVAPTGMDAAVKSLVESAVALYFQTLRTYVEGVDLVQERNDQITSLTLSQVIQEVLTANGASAEQVNFSVGGTDYDIYQLAAGELTKTGTITYVTA